MNLLKLFDDDAPRNPEARSRVIPAQPAGVPAGKVYVGSDLGAIDYTGEKPRPGDLVVIIGQQAQQVVLTGSAPKPIRNPIFNSPCACKCPGNTGVAFYLAYSSFSAYVLALDATTGTLLQVIAQNELGYGGTLASAQAASLAVDNSAPFPLYVLDDRRGFATVQTDATPTIKRGYLGVATYVLTAGQYQFSRYDPITDPYVPGPHDPINPSVEPDPPGVPKNCLSVIGGVPVVTMLKAPARYLSLAGGVYTTHTLTQNGSPSSLQLVGNIVTVQDQPANKNNRYVIGYDGAAYWLVQFSPADVITRTVALTSINPATPHQLATVCNRLLVLNATLDTFGSVVII